MSKQRISKQLRSAKQSERRYERRQVRRDLNDEIRGLHCRRAEDTGDRQLLHSVMEQGELGRTPGVCEAIDPGAR